MPSSNPALNDRIFEREIRADRSRKGLADNEVGWASPRADLPPGVVRTTAAPAPDTLSPWNPTAPPPAGPPTSEGTMRLGGVLSASAVLMCVLVVAGWFGWNAVKVATTTNLAGQEVRSASAPPWLFVALLAGLGLAILTILKPRLARFTAVLYAVAEGLLLGAISHFFEAQYKGIVLQAVGLTIGVFAMMLFLFSTRIIKVTDKLRTGVVAATGAVMLVYVASILLRFVGVNVAFIHDAGPIGILFSLVVVGIAAFNLLLDFDFIERGVAAQAPRYMEWYGAFGLLVTLVWLYLELLRLLSKLRQR